MSVFISYSGRESEDKLFAKNLITRLDEIGLDPWIYERRGSEIPPGQRIEEYCKKQIRKADHVVIIISNSALVSEYTQAEVEFALLCHDTASITPVATTCVPFDSWPAPYSQLRPFKQLRIDRAAATDLERCVADICYTVGRSYQPPHDGLPRLPLLKRLTDELRGARPNDPQYEIGIFTALREKALQVAELYEQARSIEAVEALTGLLADLKVKFPGRSFYYPYLVRGVIESEIGKEDSHWLNRARKTFRDILDDPALKGMVDENAYAGLAGVELLLGKGQAAYDLYVRAQSVVAARNESDPDLLHNIILTAISIGRPLSKEDIDQLLSWRSDSFRTKDPYLFERLTALYALGCTYIGDLERARQMLSSIDQRSTTIADLIIRLAQELSSRSKHLATWKVDDLARRMFDLALVVAPDSLKKNVMFSYAAFHYERGAMEESLRLLDMLRSMYPKDPQVLVECALCYFALGRRRQAEQYCDIGAHLPLPYGDTATTLKDFLYFRGLAKWLKGKKDLARQDFLDSGYVEDQWYEVISRYHGL